MDVDLKKLFGGIKRMVFWVCPKGCAGFVEWNKACTVATCKECGTKSTDK